MKRPLTYRITTSLCLLALGLPGTAPAWANGSPPFSEDTCVLTLRNDSQTDTLQFSTQENVTVQFTDNQQHNNKKLKFSLYDYAQQTSYLQNESMTEIDNGDGTYTYTYTFNTNTVLGGVADWYYYLITSKSPNAQFAGFLVVGTADTPHTFKTYADGAYTIEQSEFGVDETIYVEVVGDDSSAKLATQRATMTDYGKSVFLKKKVKNLTNDNGVYRFSVDLSEAKQAFTTDWYYNLEITLKHKGNQQNSFKGYTQIKIVPQAPETTKTWTQLNWREVD